MPPHACTCGEEPVVFVYSDWEAISGSQLPQDKIASWSNLGHQGGAKHARVRHLVGEDQQSVISSCCLGSGHRAQQC